MNPEGTMTDSDSRCSGPIPLDMLEILMNGVFAFVMTLIVKNNIPFPSSSVTEDIQYFIEYFMGIVGDGFSFIFTFILLAVFYLLTFEMMRHIRRVTRIFVYLMFSFLLSIVFIPLTSLVWSISDKPIPYGVLFHTNILICGLILFFLWKYVCRNPDILTPDTTLVFSNNLALRIGIFPLTAMLGLIIDGQELSFGLIPIIVLYLLPIVIGTIYVDQ